MRESSLLRPMTARPGTRVYGGASADERRAARRRRLLDTALRLYGAAGGPAASIEKLCAEANVSTSHFYEQYDSRDALLTDLYDELSYRLFAAIDTAIAAVAEPSHPAYVRAGIGAFVDHIAQDESAARMLLVVPHAGADAILPHRRATIQRTVDLLAGLADALVAAGKLPERDYSLTAIALTGAAIELLTSWFMADPRPSVDAVREELIRLHLRAV
jgi:AcrR family transcriptional regulator